MSKLKSHIIDENFNINGTIVEHNGKFYSCILNQTDILFNSNKFYVMQLVKSNSIYHLCARWGRIGDKGVISKKQFNSESDGILGFEKQFKSKTGNNWHFTNFVKKDNKYFLSEVSYENELKDIKDLPVTIPESKLPDKVQKLITMLSDVNMMQEAMIHLEIDTKKMPIGKLKQSQLDKAKEVLNNIKQLIDKLNDKPDNSTDIKTQIIKLSSDYYTYLPLNCGRKKPPVINSDEMINKYIDTVDELSNMVVTIQLKDNIKTDENPIDSIYNDINTKITPVEVGSKIWEVIKDYVSNSHAPTHNFKLELVDIYEIERKGEREKYDKKFGKSDNKQLLIHGSRMSNWVSILKNGLLLDPSRLGVYISGKMFGGGIYTANSFSKSSQYCGINQGMKGRICLTLAEVALGNECKKTQADYYITKQSINKQGFDSVWGQGQMTPDSHVVIDGNIKVPNGKLIQSGLKSSLRYDEKIVYDMDQIVLKYLVILDMSY